MSFPRLSVLDLAPVSDGTNFTETFERSVELAQSIESWGYHRFWMAEHHNMPDIASAAPVYYSVILERTRTRSV
ncbi:LLM class flavin-dependent oxidoreductase [Vibrio sp. YT-19(2023)]|uniref:LLM class flavin-dependent oxidoreductase n=1 Tax=Vibrio sp. YT-19(2023) TaxID=3074710 RepID=UPI00398C6834